MRRLFDFLPAFFCTLYLEHIVFVIYISSDVGAQLRGFSYAGPPLGLLLAIALFSRSTGFWRRFSRFKRCLLLALATVGIASVITGMLVSFEPGEFNLFESVLGLLLVSAISSIIWFPLALLISGLYCIPVWVWQGRNDPNHFAGKLIVNLPKYRFRLLWIISFGCILLLAYVWHVQPASLSWANSVPGDGDVLSLTSGKAPDGTEVVLAGGYYRSDQSGNDLQIVSLDAHDGHLRWGQRYPQSLPNMVATPTVVNDPDGDVVIAWNYWKPPPGVPKISKLSGTDGHVIWERQAQADQTLAANLGTPIPDGMGRIWIPGVSAGQDGHWNRILALLDARDGTSRWETITQQIKHTSTATDPRPAQVFPLKDGDAFSILPPYDDNGWGKTTGMIKRISGKDGATVWEQDYPSSIVDYVYDAIPLVDEAHQQVVIFSGLVTLGRPSFNVISFDLLTGKERWRSAAPGPSGRVSLDDAGNLVYWCSLGEQTSPNWLDLLLPLPLPPSGVINRERSIRKVFSSVDGKVLGSQDLSYSSVRIDTILFRPGSNQADALILRKPNEKTTVWPWRTIFLGRYFWQNMLTRSPGGEAFWRFPSQAVLTPSGNLVVAGPFVDGKRQWEIDAW